MDEPKLSSVMRVEPAELAAVFLDPRRRRILTAFMGGESSLTEAASRLAMPLNGLAYHVGRLLELGLLRMVREQKRAGRPIRHYRAAADAFLIPAAAMGRGVGDGLTAELRAALDRAEPLAGASDLLVSLDETGRPKLQRRGGTIDADACEYWRILALSAAEARQLNRELRTLLRRYEGAPGPGKAFYLAHAALAPRGAR